MNIYQSQVQFLLLRIDALEKEAKRLQAKVDELEAYESVRSQMSNILY